MNKYIDNIIEKLEQHKYAAIGLSLGGVVSALTYLYTKDTAALYKGADALCQQFTSKIPSDIGIKFNYIDSTKEHIAQVIGTSVPPIVGAILGIFADKKIEKKTQ
ncbi:MAG: hypothetical protein DRN08_06715 [Thermoplasmata archaeon]|nr:MAG: hypothetical protein DRN08_06715 [Thermoplasmata archaeon]